MEPNSQFAPRVLLAIDDLRLRRTNEAGLRAAGFAVSAVLVIALSTFVYVSLRAELEEYRRAIEAYGKVLEQQERALFGLPQGLDEARVDGGATYDLPAAVRWRTGSGGR